MEKIFVQIASYRDPELVPTIKDCIAKAKHPERLTFGICWQHSSDDLWDNLDEFKDRPEFTIMDVPWNESKGLCWARHHIQKMWKGEEYTLQIDSHHRFLQDWDIELLEMMKLTGSKKPLITSYAGMYNPQTNELLSTEPFKMVGKRFTAGGTILFYPETINEWKTLDKPIPARFVSGHFFFTLGIHCQEYKYDPNLYFAGDEISLSIRSFTLGYDLFHPHKLIIWHEYTREGRVKHWDDFVKRNEEKVGTLWHELDTISKKRLRQMLQEEDNGSDIGIYGLGTERTHREYEDYAGIDFAQRILHPNTVNGINPPTILDSSNDQWRTILPEKYNLTLDWGPKWELIRNQTSCTCKFDFIFCGVESATGDLLFRKDLTEQDYLVGKITTLQASFESLKQPTRLVLWPHKKDGDWLERVDILL